MRSRPCHANVFADGLWLIWGGDEKRVCHAVKWEVSTFTRSTREDRPMTQGTTPTPSARAFPSLLLELWLLLAAHRPAVQQTRVFDRLRGLVVGQLCTLLRHTVSQALAALGLVDTDPGAFYRLLGRGRLDYAALTHCFLGETLAQVPASGPYVAVVDGVQIPRSSRTMPGTGWLPCPR